jgi:hypothetical protein
MVDYDFNRKTKKTISPMQKYKKYEKKHLKHILLTHYKCFWLFFGGGEGTRTHV